MDLLVTVTMKFMDQAIEVAETAEAIDREEATIREEANILEEASILVEEDEGGWEQVGGRLSSYARKIGNPTFLCTMVLTARLGGIPLDIATSTAQSDLDEFRTKIWANGTKWEEHVKWLLHQELMCKPSQPMNDKSPCNYFVGNALSKVYHVNDFKTANGFLSANSIYDYVITHSVTWKDIGFAGNQEVAKRAQELANGGYPVIALRVGQVHGHVALIIPGRLIMSESWQMELPNSAAFILDEDASFNVLTDKNKTYVGRALSWSWNAQEGKDVKIFYRRN